VSTLLRTARTDTLPGTFHCNKQGYLGSNEIPVDDFTFIVPTGRLYSVNQKGVLPPDLGCGCHEVKPCSCEMG
jgi:hypothetical protein